jgi:hypothetical protein
MRRGRRSTLLLDKIKERTEYSKLKPEVLNFCLRKTDCGKKKYENIEQNLSTKLVQQIMPSFI